VKIIICDLEGSGAKWVFFGEKVLVNVEFLEDFKKEHPEWADSIAAARSIESYMGKLPEVI